MPTDGNIKLEDQSLVFLGKIMASISHELNNTVAIIKEYNGLLEDMLLGVQRGNPIDDKKVERVSKKIASQTEKGTEIIKRFNKFAHSMDYPVNSIKLDELLPLIIGLSRRLTEIKGIYLTFDGMAESITLKTNPLLLQQAVFLGLEMFMADADSNSQLILSAGKTDNKVYIEITGSKIAENDLIESAIQTLEIVMKNLNGVFEKKIEGKDKQAVILTLQDLETDRA